MCGRFALSIIPARFQRVFGVAPPEGYRARWNIAPETPVLTVRAGEDGAREAVPVRWGMLGPWMKDPKDPGRQINARAESAAEKPMFRAAFRQHRCVIPADGFYEWQKGGGGPSRPFFVRRRDGEPLAFAGLWQPVRLDSGERLETCAILTTAASPLLRPIHSRMPVMLRPEVDRRLARPDGPRARVPPGPARAAAARRRARGLRGRPRRQQPPPRRPRAGRAPGRGAARARAGQPSLTLTPRDRPDCG